MARWLDTVKGWFSSSEKPEIVEGAGPYDRFVSVDHFRNTGELPTYGDGNRLNLQVNWDSQRNREDMAEGKRQVSALIEKDEKLKALLDKPEWTKDDSEQFRAGLSRKVSLVVSQASQASEYRTGGDLAYSSDLEDLRKDVEGAAADPNYKNQYFFNCGHMSTIEATLLHEVETDLAKQGILAGEYEEGSGNYKYKADYYVANGHVQYSGNKDDGGYHGYGVARLHDDSAYIIEGTADELRRADHTEPFLKSHVTFAGLVSGEPAIAQAVNEDGQPEGRIYMYGPHAVLDEEMKTARLNEVLENGYDDLGRPELRVMAHGNSFSEHSEAVGEHYAELYRDAEKTLTSLPEQKQALVDNYVQALEKLGYAPADHTDPDGNPVRTDKLNFNPTLGETAERWGYMADARKALAELQAFNQRYDSQLPEPLKFSEAAPSPVSSEEVEARSSPPVKSESVPPLPEPQEDIPQTEGKSPQYETAPSLPAGEEEVLETRLREELETLNIPEETIKSCIENPENVNSSYLLRNGLYDPYADIRDAARAAQELREFREEQHSSSKNTLSQTNTIPVGTTSVAKMIEGGDSSPSPLGLQFSSAARGPDLPAPEPEPPTAPSNQTITFSVSSNRFG